MKDPHTPTTQAELDEWKAGELTLKDGLRLIAEVERLTALHQADLDVCILLEMDIARLTKEVEELRKEQRLSRCPFCLEDNFDSIGLKHHLLAGHCHPWNTTSSPWPAMQQKGEE
jgi:hypothetical protein